VESRHCLRQAYKLFSQPIDPKTMKKFRGRFGVISSNPEEKIEVFLGFPIKTTIYIDVELGDHLRIQICRRLSPFGYQVKCLPVSTLGAAL
jgi:hypothetical protein